MSLLNKFELTLITISVLNLIDFSITMAAQSKVGRTAACVKTCNSQDTMSAT
jgi:hypothetical protein